MKKLIIIFVISICITTCISFTCGYFFHKELSKPSLNKDFEIQRLNNLVSNLKNNLVEKDKKIEDLEQNIQNNNNYGNTEYKHKIDIEEEKCIETSNTLDYPNCSYYAKEQWQKEINKYIKLLKKEMNTTDYSLININQEKWEQSLQSDTEMIEKYINSKQGLIYVTIETNTIKNIYKSRALLLGTIYNEYMETQEILYEENNLN